MTARLAGVVLGLLGLAAAARAETAQPPTLAEALAALRLRPKVDLTRPLDATTPVPSGFGRPRIMPAVDPRSLEAFTLRRDGFRATYYALPGPTGTHVEAPASVSADGRTLDAIPPDEMMLPLVVLDDTPFLAADPSHAFSPCDLAAHEKAHGRVPAGSFVALRTDPADASSGSADRAYSRGRPLPGWSLAALKQLFEERGVIAVGYEGMEATSGRDGADYVLGHGHWMVAGLAHLDAVPATGAAILVSWPKAAGGLAFPARPVAVLP